MLTTRRHYVGCEKIPGWQEFDARQAFSLRRTELLRPLIGSTPPRHIFDSAHSILAVDMPLRKRSGERLVSSSRRRRSISFAWGSYSHSPGSCRRSKYKKRYPAAFIFMAKRLVPDRGPASMPLWWKRAADSTQG